MSLSTTSTSSSTHKLSDDTGKSAGCTTSSLSADALSSAISAIKQQQRTSNGHQNGLDGRPGTLEEVRYTSNTCTGKMTNGHHHHRMSGQHHRYPVVSSPEPEPEPEPAPARSTVMAQLVEEMRIQIELSNGMDDGGEGQTAGQLDKDSMGILRGWLDQEFAGELVHGVRRNGCLGKGLVETS